MAGRAQHHVLLASLLFCAGTANAFAEEPAPGASEAAAATDSSAPLAGHSAHGAAYNEGPRQDAYLMGGTGNVHFKITTSSEAAQTFFSQGVGQLHGFWFYEAERSFRRVAALDPKCAMAYWGMASANFDNLDRAREFIAEASRKMDTAGEREKQYISALAEYLKDDERKEQDRRSGYVKALEKIIREYPDDIEAKAFLAVFLWQSNRKGLPINSYAALNSLLEDVLRVEPMHPAHHYRIHLWDNEEPAQALPAAALCGQAAPSIAHMWHMPGHIYSRLERYGDAAWQQEASARADHAYMIRDLVLPDQIHNYAHNNEWLVRNLIHLGRVNEALSLAKNMLELPRHPKYNSFARDGSCSCQYGRKRLIDVLESFEMWDETVALSETMYLEPTQIPAEQVRRYRLLGVAQHHLGNFSDADRCRAELERIREEWNSELESLSGSAEEKDADDQGSENSAEETSDGESSSPPDAEAEKAAKKARDERRELLKKGTQEAERALAELDVLRRLACGETEQAKRELPDVKGIPSLRQARYWFRSGDPTKAEEVIASAVASSPNEVPPRAVQVDLLHRMGKAEEARTAMQSLRNVAADADLDAPLLQRVKPVAEQMQLPDNWRVPRPAAADVGKRPELASLGPFRWTPTAAPDWSLPDSNGRLTTLGDNGARPVLAIFYLGFGCLHCVEQVQAFAPRRQDFSDAGIELVAISIESTESIARSIKNFNDEGTFPFPLLSDEPLEAFKAFRVYDDFEQMPLHATFLIDGERRIRWHDIGYEPFMDVDFVLEESSRLLAMDGQTPPTDKPAQADRTAAAP